MDGGATWTPSYENFDGISVALTGSVPEPSTWAMMLLGFACLVLLGRRTGLKSASAQPDPARRRRVSLIVTEMAVIEPTEAGLVLRERGPGVSLSEIKDATAASLIIERGPPEMALN